MLNVGMEPVKKSFKPQKPKFFAHFKFGAYWMVILVLPTCFWDSAQHSGLKTAD